MNTALTISDLRRAYAEARLDPDTVIGDLRLRAEQQDEHAVWIHCLPQAALHAHLRRVASLDGDAAPLKGVPFAIKDNIDLAGAPTTAACPAYAYSPDRSATVVQHLLDAGAIPLGKTNMDQFATGLTGTRSPYGEVRNAIHPDYIAGGSSSGSAVAVKLGLAAFALGTDTAGSGRVPAAFNGLVGFKPTRGWWSNYGVVPACRSLDCVSVFTRTVADAREVARAAAGFDPRDPFSRQLDFTAFDSRNPRFGYASSATLPFGDEAYRACYAAFVERLPGAPRIVGMTPFYAAGSMLYDGPWLAERYAAVGDFLARSGDAVLPITRNIIDGGKSAAASEAFQAQYRLAALRREIEAVFDDIDVLVLPTAPTIYTRKEVAEAPFETNARLGTFTNFVNLLDLCAIAIPAGETPTGLPFGVTLMALAGRDHALLNTAAVLRGEDTASSGLPQTASGELPLAVCGAHMAGEPLNGELRRRGAYRIGATRTAPRYRLYALPDGKRPALLRTAKAGAAVDVEVWSLPEREVGGFLRTVAAPLGIGSVELADGTWVSGFIGQADAAEGAADITRFGGWRHYLASRRKS